MNANKKAISVKILDREYHFKCPPEEADKLKKAVVYLDSKMRKVHDSGNAVGFERAAIIAAVDICYELISMRAEKDTYTKTVYERIKKLQVKVEKTIADNKIVAHQRTSHKQ